jgi:hypothetical protein
LNVYRIRSVCEVERTGKDPRQVYASAPGSPRGVDMVEHFDGKPYPERWPKSVTLTLRKPKLLRPDFFAFHPKALLCTPHTVDVVGGVMRSAGELFPVKVRGVKGTCQVINITRLLGRAFDPAKSLYRVGSFRRLTQPAFRADKIARDVSLFKLPQNHGNAIYCVERTANPADGEFKALVEEQCLTGLEFELIWTDRKPTERKPRKRPVAKRRER